MKIGTLYGLGLGPGDPELLTLKAHRILQEVSVLFVPVGTDDGTSVARTIAEPFLEPTRQQIQALRFPMIKDFARAATTWRAHADTIAATLQSGHDAAFLTEGDPSLYSTFQHVRQALLERHPDVPVVVVPGVSSVNATAAVAGIPLADRDDRLAIVPATYDRDDLRTILTTFDTVVLLKVAAAFDRVADLLDDLGMADRAIYVRRCGWPEQEVIHDLSKLRGRKLDYFSTLVVRRKQ